ncbi:MAG: hypothetical protein R3245_07820 [Kiloniellales bacterium]|nr:hypothetical protein [Kiloniellales bacterium]
MFADVQADVYLVADGDAPYSPNVADKMISLIDEGNYMVVAHRLKSDDEGKFRRGHVLCNQIFTALPN